MLLQTPAYSPVVFGKPRTQIRARKMERVSVGVFRLAIAPLEAAGGAGPGADVQAPAAADGIVQDIQALRR